MKNEKENREELWREFLGVARKYSDKITMSLFVQLQLMFVFKMMFDSIPNGEVIKTIAEKSMKAGYDWHLEEKTMKNKEKE